MLMVVDIGNSNIVIGLFEGEDLIRDWRLYTDLYRTDDEYAATVRSFFRDSDINPGSIGRIIISSVVPGMNETFTRMINKITGKIPLVLGPAHYGHLPVKVPESALQEIGSDLVCNAVAAYLTYKAACIIVDFGTALTFTAIGPDGSLRGAAIAPGLGTAVKSLFQGTAKLPDVPLELPPSSLGINSIQAIQAGVVLGYQGLVETLISRMRAEMGELVPVIATGGLSHVFKTVPGIFDRVDEGLTLRGLRLISEMIP